MKNLKLSLKAHPQHTMQVMKQKSVVLVNAGSKVLIFDMRESLMQGESGLKQCISNVELHRACHFETLNSKCLQGKHP